MWKFALGPVLLGVGYVAGAIHGDSAEQLVRERPEIVRAAIADQIAMRADGGTMRFEGAKVPYQVSLDRSASDRLVMHLRLNGRQAAETEFTFTPQDEAEATLVQARVRSDGQVLREDLAGTSKAKLGYAPDWMLNLTLQPLLRQLGEQIEQGSTIANNGQGFEPLSDMPSDQQQEVDRWRQYEATRPLVDPNEAAREYLERGGE